MAILESYEVLASEIHRKAIAQRAVDLANRAKDQDMVIFVDDTLDELFPKVFEHLYPGIHLPQVRHFNIDDEIRRKFKDSPFSPDNRDRLVRTYGTGQVLDWEDELTWPILHGSLLVQDDFERPRRDDYTRREIAETILDAIDPNGLHNNFQLAPFDSTAFLHPSGENFSFPWVDPETGERDQRLKRDLNLLFEEYKDQLTSI